MNFYHCIYEIIDHKKATICLKYYNCINIAKKTLFSSFAQNFLFGPTVPPRKILPSPGKKSADAHEDMNF